MFRVRCQSTAEFHRMQRTELGSSNWRQVARTGASRNTWLGHNDAPAARQPDDETIIRHSQGRMLSRKRAHPLAARRHVASQTNCPDHRET
jgi:hypothetical protein